MCLRARMCVFMATSRESTSCLLGMLVCCSVCVSVFMTYKILITELRLKRASMSSWGGSPTSFLTRNTCLFSSLHIQRTALSCTYTRFLNLSRR